MREHLCALWLIGGPLVGVAQPGPAALAGVREFPTPFTRIGSVRELRDGRVILADRREQSLMLLDWRSQGMQPIGRRGAGPREFELPDALVAVPGDSTWVWDAMNFRWLVLDPVARPVLTLTAVETSSAMNRGEFLGADGVGDIYLRTEVQGTGNPLAGSSGRGAVLRLSRVSWRLDTIATLRVPAGRLKGARPLGNGNIRLIDNRPLAAEDMAAVAGDGRVAVIRVPEYRVEWHRSGEAPRAGPPLPHEPIPVTAAERRAFIAGQTVPGRILVSGGRVPAAGPTVSRLPQAKALPPGALDADADALPWPRHLPPVQAGARVAPDGILWVPRSRPHTVDRRLYDLVDDRGRVVKQVELPPRTRMLGFGARHMYLVRTDADDLDYLQRVAYPAAS